MSNTLSHLAASIEDRYRTLAVAIVRGEDVAEADILAALNGTNRSMVILESDIERLRQRQAALDELAEADRLLQESRNVHQERLDAQERRRKAVKRAAELQQQAKDLLTSNRDIDEELRCRVQELNHQSQHTLRTAEKGLAATLDPAIEQQIREASDSESAKLRERSRILTAIAWSQK